MNKTINYYNKNSSEYIEQTKSIDTSMLINSFLDGLPKGSHILDLGCGSGRDSKIMQAKGYNITALDASKELADKLKKECSFEVINNTFEEYNPNKKFDAIYAMASLLHLSKIDFKRTLNKYSELLKENGKFFICVKMGSGESYDEKERFFSYYNPQEIKDIFNELKLVEPLITITNDSIGRSNYWINITYRKNKKLNNIFDKDMISVSEWLNTKSENILYEKNKEPIEKYKKQIDEMESTYKEFPNDFKRTKKIYDKIKNGEDLYPIYVEKEDETNFVMEGRHRMVAFKWLGLNEVNVTRVSKINNKMK